MSETPPTRYDALLIVGFGGPERREDVIPFLENVTRGRNVPRERLLEVAEHYYHFGGVSPINGRVREQPSAPGRRPWTRSGCSTTTPTSSPPTLIAWPRRWDRSLRTAAARPG